MLESYKQPTSALVYVKEEDPSTNDVEDIEKRYTPELVAELQSAKDDALLLYTEYTGQAGADLKVFLKEMAGMMEETRRSLEGVSAVIRPSRWWTSSADSARGLFLSKWRSKREAYIQQWTSYG
ncbi:hypothetical protein MSG28_008315 [Choristoneura fumiferana]|uniref:Uncharacterized protein n=1 Tax=Choristoneura fumiferana TaxID=7141 RepID=A0ACC0JAY7_CHOFU|nr:hypothetical protein MSG28_008315 [Choristoneura fumiferana]